MNEVTKNKPVRHIDIVAITQPPVQYVIFEEEGKRVAGYCLITANFKRSKIEVLGVKPLKEAAIWHIYVDEAFRGKGYAKNLLEALKYTYDTIYTQALTKEGKKLLENNGFLQKDDKILRWTKKMNDEKK